MSLKVSTVQQEVTNPFPIPYRDLEVEDLEEIKMADYFHLYYKRLGSSYPMKEMFQPKAF